MRFRHRHTYARWCRRRVFSAFVSSCRWLGRRYPIDAPVTVRYSSRLAFGRQRDGSWEEDEMRVITRRLLIGALLAVLALGMISSTAFARAGFNAVIPGS